MLRSLFRRKRTIRVPIEDSGRNIQQVKIFRRPFSKPSTFITTFILGYFVSSLYEAYTTDPASRRTTRGTEKPTTEHAGATTSQTLSEHWKKQHESIRKNTGDGTISSFPPDLLPPDVISTITLPVWIRERKSSLYTADDAEAKDYARIQADPHKIEQLKKQVGHWAAARLKNPVHELNLKYIGFNGKIGLMLNLVPQLHAPPLWEVPAVIIFKDGIGLGWKVLRPDLGGRMEAVFRPSATYDAAKASIQVFFLTSYAIIKAKFTGEQPITASPKFIKPSSKVSEKDIARDNNMPSLANMPAGMNTATMQELMKVLHNGAGTRERHSDLIKQLPLSTAVQMATATFRHKQLHGVAQAQQARTRGVLQIRGNVVCFGKMGRYQMNVIAFYLPAEDKFLGPLVVTSAYVVKDYNQWNQLEEQAKKSLLDRQSNIRPNSDTQVSTDKVPPVDEKEEGTK